VCQTEIIVNQYGFLNKKQQLSGSDASCVRFRYERLPKVFLYAACRAKKDCFRYACSKELQWPCVKI